MEEKKNFMDYVPVCNPGYSWDADKKGIVTVHVVNKGFYNWLAQKFFKKPRISHIALDEYEKSLFLTQAQEEEVLSLYNAREDIEI